MNARRYGCAWWLLHRYETAGATDAVASAAAAATAAAAAPSSPAAPANWVAAGNLAGASQPAQYIHALYKSAAILVAFGYGNSPPLGSFEVALTPTEPRTMPLLHAH